MLAIELRTSLFEALLSTEVPQKSVIRTFSFAIQSYIYVRGETLFEAKPVFLLSSNEFNFNLLR